MNHGTFSDGPFTRTEDTFVIRPAGFDAWIHRLFVGRDGVDLKIRPDGFQHGNMWGLTQHKWSEVSAFGSDYLGIKYTRMSDRATRLIPQWYLSYGLVESLQVMLNGYRLAALAAPGGVSDDEVVREANQTSCVGVQNPDVPVQMSVIGLGVVGMHRPHLLPKVARSAFSIPWPPAEKSPPGYQHGAAIEAAMMAVEPNPLWPLHPLFDAFNWLHANIDLVRPSLTAAVEEHQEWLRELRATNKK